ncbi:type VI secretion system baseplate subunit TssK [Pseudomonas sp. R1-6]
MKIDRPLWTSGTLLSAQQFQQQARWEAWANEQRAGLALAHPWGVTAVEFDTDALGLGKLKATRLSVCMPDGTLKHWAFSLVATIRPSGCWAYLR